VSHAPDILTFDTVSVKCRNLRLRIRFLQYGLYRHLDGAIGLTGSDDRPGWLSE